jgi:hypothetical protein
MARVDNLAGWRTGAKIQIPGLIGSRTMSLTAEQGEGIKNELKRIAGDLNLSDEQKTKLHERLSSAADKLHEYKKSHPNVTRQAHHQSGRIPPSRTARGARALPYPGTVKEMGCRSGQSERVSGFCCGVSR